ncbi:hypothetical protein M0R45_018696 [Rubus argutus]|uniref:PI31 proteasome regulator N-terminal domain-containing protein n=1 Tax=Rubus argutus TaxID=59490 RepID=A0AAW1X5N7_RUBAR
MRRLVKLEKKSWIDDGIGHGYRQRSKAVAACDCGRRCRRGVEARGALVNRRCWAEGKIAVVEHGRGDAGGSPNLSRSKPLNLLSFHQRAARPTFRNNNDKVAFAVHASFLASGYELIATGPPAFSDSALSSSSTDEVGIDRWNELDDEYAFIYTNSENGSKKKLLVKCLVMNDKLLVDALADGMTSESVHLEINVGDYVGENSSNYSSQFKNLETLVKSLDTQVLSKLDGSSKASSSTNNNALSSERSERSKSEPGTGPSYPHPSRIVYPLVNPIGDSDCFLGPGAGMFPTRFDDSGTKRRGSNGDWKGWRGHGFFATARNSVEPYSRLTPLITNLVYS